MFEPTLTKFFCCHRRAESRDMLSIERSSTATINHPWIKIVIDPPEGGNARGRPSEELAEDINLWIQNGLEAARIKGSKSAHRPLGTWSSRQGSLSTFLNRLPHKGPFGCLACRPSLDSQTMNRESLPFSDDRCPAAAVHPLDYSWSSAQHSAKGLPSWENIKRICGLWKLDREQSDSMDGFCDIMELGWLQRRAVKTLRHLRVCCISPRLAQSSCINSMPLVSSLHTTSNIMRNHNRPWP